jgi:cytochrome c oxidase subunit 2
MTKRMTAKEIAGVLGVVLVLVGLPLLLWSWQAGTLLETPYPPGTRIITLTAIADGGIWTKEEVVGHNYWRRKPTPVNEIEINLGDHIVLRLHSADVLHSFAIPVLRLGPVDVPAGHTVELEFDADRTGVLTFLCWQMCSPEHPKLRGHFLVKGGASEEEDEEW